MKSLPTMKVTMTLTCGCKRFFEQKYVERPDDVGTPKECPVHGATEVKSWSRLSK